MKIQTFLNSYVHGTYTINKKGVVDVDGSVICSRGPIPFIPCQFGHVSVDFIITGVKLISLKGVPQTVGRDFSVENNMLTSLKHGPIWVGANYFCNNNQISTLKGAPKYILGHFKCDKNLLKSLVDGPIAVGGHLSCCDNKLTSLHGSFVEVSKAVHCYRNPLTSLKGIAHIGTGDQEGVGLIFINDSEGYKFDSPSESVKIIDHTGMFGISHFWSSLVRLHSG